MYDDDDQQPFTPAFADVAFADNPEPRCPVMLLLDTSGSMQGDAIEQLNAGIKQLRDELLQDPLAAKRVEIAIVTFGPVKLATPFATVDAFNPPKLSASGGTPLGEAIVTGIDHLKDRKREYRTAGIPYYRPWIMVITDGSPTDDWTRAARLVAEGEERKSHSFFAVGVENADMDTLARISTRQPLKLKGLAFGDLFAWLSNSLGSVSRSNVGQAAALTNPAAPNGWAVAG